MSHDDDNHRPGEDNRPSAPPFPAYVARPSFFPEESPEQSRTFVDDLQPSLRPPPRKHAYSNDSGLYNTQGLRTSGPGESDEISSVTLFDTTQETAAEGGGTLRPSLRPGLISALLGERERPGDEGAAAAVRTLPRRKRADTSLAWVGEGVEVEAARLRLLGHLADRSTGSHRARLLVACAELHGRRGQTEQARDAHENAHAADPNDVLALRRHLRDSLRVRDVDRSSRLLRELAAPNVSGEERALALCALAELHHGQPSEVARQALDDALALQPASLTAGLLRAELAWKSHDLTGCAEALRRCGELCTDPVARATLLLQAARLREHLRDMSQALPLYARASAADERSYAAVLGMYRCCRATHDLSGAERALARLAEMETDDTVREALVCKRAQILHCALGRPAEALALLASARSVVGLRQRVRAAEALAHEQAQLDALTDWVNATSGGERALALVELARFHGTRGQTDLAALAVREASLAGAPRGLLALAREAVARATGDAAALARAAEDEDAGGTLRAAAKLALDSAQLDRELPLLVRATASHDSTVCAELLSLDAAAESTDLEYLRTGLRAAMARLPPSERSGTVLALLALTRDPDQTHALLQQLRDAPEDDALAARCVASRTDDPWLAGQAFGHEAVHTTGPRAAFAATMAGRYLDDAGADPTEAYTEALDAVPAYPSAAHALEVAARRHGGLVALQRVVRELAEAAPTPLERSARYVRLALLAADSDPAAAMMSMQHALRERPGDRLLAELSIRLSDGASASTFAALHATAAEFETVEPFARALQLRAAAAHEDAGAWTTARACYERLLARDAGDTFSAIGRHVTLHQAEDHAALVAEHEARWLSAETRAQRIAVLERLAELEVRRGARDRARAALQTILESEPASTAALRGLERIAWEEGDESAELAVATANAEHGREPAERAAQLRLALRLCVQLGTEDEGRIVRHGDGVRHDLACALIAEGVAVRSGNQARLYEALLSATYRLEAPMERAAYAVRAAELAHSEAPQRAVADLEEGLRASSEHPLAAEELGRLQRSGGDPRGAADTFMQAATRGPVSPKQRARLLHAAAVLFQDELGEPQRAIASLAQVVEIDVLHADAFPRLRALLTASGDTAALLQLLSHRLAARIEPSLAAELQQDRAHLLLTQRDHAGAKLALQASLTEDPTRTAALRELAELYKLDGEFREAAEALVKLARIAVDPSVLSYAFFELGTLYDGVLEDARRAEIAFTRVVSLAPNDPRPVERLVALWLKRGDTERALRALRHLVSVTGDPAQRERYVIELADVLERTGDARLAEQTLDAERRARPAALPILTALTGLYTRQQDRSALAMHLARSCHALRAAIEQTPADEALWLGLTDLLHARDRHDGAVLVAAAGRALGLHAPGLASGEVTGLRHAAISDSVFRKLHAYGAPDALRALMAALPESVTSLLAQTVDDGTPLVDDSRAAQTVAELFGFDPSSVLLLGTAQPVCIPVSDRPLTLLVHRETFEQASVAERAFLLGRAAAAAKHGYTALLRTTPDQLLLLVHAIKRLFTPGHTVAAIDMDELMAFTKRLAGALSVDERTKLEPLAIDLFAEGEVNPRRLTTQALDVGARLMLSVTGDVTTAFDALLRLRGRGDAHDAEQRAAVVKIDTHLRALLSFAISEVYLDVRREALASAAAGTG